MSEIVLAVRKIVRSRRLADPVAPASSSRAIPRTPIPTARPRIDQNRPGFPKVVRRRTHPDVQCWFARIDGIVGVTERHCTDQDSRIAAETRGGRPDIRPLWSHGPN